MSLVEQDEVEQGIHYSYSWGESDLKRGYNTLGPNYRYPTSTRTENNPISLQQPRNDMNVESSSTGSKLDSSRPANVDGVDDVAGTASTLPQCRSKLSSVDEAVEQYDENYLTGRQERLDSLRKS